MLKFCILYNTLDKVYSNHNIKIILSKTNSFLTKETHQSVHHSRHQYNLHHHHCPLLCSQNYIFISQATCVSKTFLFVIFVLFVCLYINNRENTERLHSAICHMYNVVNIDRSLEFLWAFLICK